MITFGSTKVNTIDMHLKTIYASLITAIALLFVASSVNAQCETWVGSADKDKLENEHMFYRDALKSYKSSKKKGSADNESLQKAMELWENVYKAAPGADGKRATHYVDGRFLIKESFASETDETKRAGMLEQFLELYDKEYACYPKDKTGKDKMGYFLENKAYELYYTFNHDRDVIFETLESAAELSGKNMGYSIIYPYADIAVNFFTEKKLDADKARSLHKYINEVCDENIKTNEKFKAYYQQQKDLANQRFEAIGGDIFGCAFHVKKIKPEYDANPDDKENYTRVYQLLESYGCDSSEPLMNEIYTKMKKDRDQQIAANQAALDAKKQEIKESNVAYMANQAYKSGDYDTAISKYNEAINKESDTARKADYHYYLAVIYGRKLNKYSKAREHIRKSASLNPSSGKPYLLLGDLYAKSARSCGKNGFEQRMVVIAAVNQWSKAKSMASDSDVRANASKNINAYSGQLPDKEEVFLNGYKVGGKFKIGCWIGETVTIRAK